MNIAYVSPRVPASPSVSLVIPVHNERDNLAVLLREIARALQDRVEFEVIYVDDASVDGTLPELIRLKQAFPQLRVLHHAARSGQSAAIRTGVKAARSRWIATLDGDGQNDPADLLRLLQARQESAADVRLLAGWRVDRRDTASRRWASRWANAIRARLLGDATPDTGCGIKLFERDAFLDLPYFDHMHRFLPALMQRAGWKTVSIPVNHRPRTAGSSKYGNFQRALVGVRDLRGVAWLISRSHCTRVQEV